VIDQAEQALKLRIRALELTPPGAGPAGPQGPTGATGAAGSKWLSGTGAPGTGLGAVGDWFLNTTTSDAYEKTGATAWTLRVNLKGVQGPQGPQGVPGSGYKELRGRLSITVPSNSRYVLSLAAGGFTTFGGITVTGEWGGAGPGLPPVIVPETPTVTASGLTLMFYKPPAPGATDAAWYVGPCAFSYLAWGT
jgi:hypothetical protein